MNITKFGTVIGKFPHKFDLEEINNSLRLDDVIVKIQYTKNHGIEKYISTTPAENMILGISKGISRIVGDNSLIVTIKSGNKYVSIRLRGEHICIPGCESLQQGKDIIQSLFERIGFPIQVELMEISIVHPKTFT